MDGYVKYVVENFQLVLNCSNISQMLDIKKDENYIRSANSVDK